MVKVFDFTSERKAMTVVARDIRSGKMMAFVKGADSSMMNMLKPEGQDPNHDKIVKKVA